VLVVPPFAEEMNKSRRMVTLVAEGLAEAGIATVIPDLYGTGDSGGDFEDADWNGWLEDLRSVKAWLGESQGESGILAIRLGAALAYEAVQRGIIANAQQTVLWQPVFEGKTVVRQFLRLRVAAAMAAGTPQETLHDLLAALARGESVHVAGYRLSGTLAQALQAVTPPEKVPAALGALHWMEVVRSPAVGLAAASLQLIESWSRHGAVIHIDAVVGEPFWAATEIVSIDAMVGATIKAFASTSLATVGV
jgi:exosortase A-associated hydrolase 2